jgi:hypothetical protein
VKLSQEVRMIKPKVGKMSLVGIHERGYPFSFGNYFSFRSGERCANMWAENLQEYVERTKCSNLECMVFSVNELDKHVAIVIDSAVPKDWLNDDICLTGYGGLPAVMWTAVCAYYNAPTDNRICGCEEPFEMPGIRQHNTNDIFNNICNTCKREWPYVSTNS